MRSFTVPFDIDSEDKIIGGYISLRQLLWLGVTLILILILFVFNTGYLNKTMIDNTVKVTTKPINLTIRIILSVILLIINLLFAFLKIKGISFDKYIIKSIQYKFRKHILLP